MPLIPKIKRILRLGFYVGLGGVAAVASACSSNPRRSDTGLDTDSPRDADVAQDADITGDADIARDAEMTADADEDARIQDADQKRDAESRDADDDMWDVVYE